MNRRGFLKRLGAAVAGYALSGQLAGLIPKPPAVIQLADQVGATFKVGDVFTIKGIYRFDPDTRLPTSELQEFTITAEDVPDVKFT